jgi:hypothetical protein
LSQADTKPSEPTPARGTDPVSAGSGTGPSPLADERPDSGPPTTTGPGSSKGVGDSRTSGGPAKAKRSLFERLEAFVSRLSTRNNFWHRVCSLIWLPYAFRSGITMRKVDENTFSAVLPFKKFNKNWYNAMAGAALLGNSEIAGGSYVFGVCGGDYTVVCKHLDYKFLRPCFGPAEYRITPLEDIHALVKTGEEFNITVRMNIVQVLPAKKPKDRDATPGKMSVGRDKRVGRCEAAFHVTPKQHNKTKKKARKG